MSKVNSKERHVKAISRIYASLFSCFVSPSANILVANLKEVDFLSVYRALSTNNQRSESDNELLKAFSLLLQQREQESDDSLMRSSLFQMLQPVRDGLSNLVRRILMEIMQPFHDHRALCGPGAAKRVLTRSYPAWISLNI